MSKPNIPNSKLNFLQVVAVAFSCQVVESLPINEYDQKIDEVIYAD